MADIDNLVIKISAQTGRAVGNINKLVTALDNLNGALGRIDTSGINNLSNVMSSISGMTASMRDSSRAAQQLSGAVANIGNQNGQVAQTANAAQNLSQGMQQASQATSGAASALSRSAQNTQTLGNSLNNVSNNARRAARSIREAGSSAKSATKHFSGLTKGLGRIGKMLKLMVTRMVLRKVIQGVLDGFKNLAQYSSTFDATLSLLWNSFRQLGNSIAAAVSPLLNALAPAINYIIQLFIKAVNVINQFISALTGLGTWTRAKTLTDDYAKSLDKSNKSAKALKKTVLGFDELNQLQDNNSGGGGGTSPADMFEQVPIDPKILNFVDNMKKKIGELKKYWDAFKTGFKKGLGDDWKDKVDLIKDGVNRIKDAIDDIWNDPEVSKAREEFLTSFSEAAGAVAGTAARVGLNVGANFAQGVANSVEEKSPEIKEYAKEMFNIGTDVSKQVEEVSLAVGEISDVLVGDNAIQATTEFSNLFTETFMGITENAARLGDDVIHAVTQPIIDNKDAIKSALDDMFGSLAELGHNLQTIVKDLRDILSDVWENHLHPMFEQITEALSGLTDIALRAWGYLAPIFHEVNDAVSEFWNTYMKPIADDLLNIIGIIGHAVAALVNHVVVPAIGALVDKWFPRIKDAISILISIFKVVYQTVATIVQTITFILRSFLQFFETGFTKGFSTACEEFGKAWSDQWDSMLEKVKGIGRSIIEVVQNMVNAIIHGLNFFGDKFKNMGEFQIPAWLGGGTFSLKNLAFHIDDINILSMFSSGGGRGFRNGGFPEDGWFRASHGEIMGRFDNGQSVVASNQQITDGIARAVFNAMTSAQTGGGGQYINNTIVVDGDVIARAVTKGQDRLNRRYSPTMA